MKKRVNKVKKLMKIKNSVDRKHIPVGTVIKIENYICTVLFDDERGLSLDCGNNHTITFDPAQLIEPLYCVVFEESEP